MDIDNFVVMVGLERVGLGLGHGCWSGSGCCGWSILVDGEGCGVNGERLGIG